MAVASALRLASHGPAVAAATAAAVATASIATEVPDRIAGNPAEAMVVYPAYPARSSSFYHHNGNNRLSQILSIASSPRQTHVNQSNLCSPHPVCPNCGSCSRETFACQTSNFCTPPSSYISNAGPSFGLCLDTQQAYLRILCSPQRSSSHHLLRSHSALSSSFLPPLTAPIARRRSALSFAPLTFSETLRELAFASFDSPADASSSPGGGLEHVFGFSDPFAFSSLARSTPGGGQPLHSSLSSRSLHAWHSPTPGSFRGVSEPESLQGGQKARPSTTVILLGWLGAQQRHLRRIAEWYNSQGIHAVTFVIPMSTILSIGVNGGAGAEETIDHLVNEIERWVRAHQPESGPQVEPERSLVFHTFSNTGWLTYGAILDRLMKRGGDLVNNIKGCIVDSAPAAHPDPHVWASGFSAALLKKRSVAARMGVLVPAPEGEGGGKAEAPKLDNPAGPGKTHVVKMPQAGATEKALQAVLAKFFAVFLEIPVIKSKLREVTTILSSRQPPCPQLYIYSTTDTVIPASSVESFMEEQRKGGRVVMATRMEGSPHVDHFRTSPHVYTSQVASFLQHCMPHWEAPSRPEEDNKGLNSKRSNQKHFAQT